MDGLGNVIGSGLDGSSGAAILYDAWGNVETDSTAMMRLNTLRFGYKGMLYDETTGLYNARARWYDPEVGRFISEDPIGLAGGMNQYAFAGDDPIDRRDPSGALVTDGDGSVCSINAESCGDPLQTGAGGGTGAAIGSTAGGFGGNIGGGGGGSGGIPPRIKKAIATGVCLLTLNALPFCTPGNGPEGGQTSNTQSGDVGDPGSWFQTKTALPPEQPQPIDTTVNHVPLNLPTCYSILQCAKTNNWHLPTVSPATTGWGALSQFLASPFWALP